jgi:hypothetical protein
VSHNIFFGKQLFNPDHLKELNTPLLVKDYKMKEMELEHFGKMVSKLRADITDRVNSLRDDYEVEHDSSDEEHKDYKSVMLRSFTKIKERHKEEYSLIGSES